MVIVFDVVTGKRITDHGTNSAFPDGNIPGLEPQPGQVFYRIHDDDPWVEQYLAGDLANVTAIIVNGEVIDIQIPIFVPGPVQPPQPTELELANKKIESLETQLSQTNTDFQEFMSFFFENNPALA